MATTQTPDPEEAGERRPLDGVRVLDLATFVAAPFSASILGEFGAEVIKVEQPGTGDPLRALGKPSGRGEDSYFWLSEARNKRSVTLDLRQPEGARGRRPDQASTRVLRLHGSDQPERDRLLSLYARRADAVRVA